mmetsp:Transcript_10387/g.17865  ORF Transcript_10387/g.17865 Transcript_10387/m.17865 type:complete len:215 (+) Transcript_10387:1455-2099(+)
MEVDAAGSDGRRLGRVREGRRQVRNVRGHLLAGDGHLRDGVGQRSVRGSLHHAGCVRSEHWEATILQEPQDQSHFRVYDQVLLEDRPRFAPHTTGAVLPGEAGEHGVLRRVAPRGLCGPQPGGIRLRRAHPTMPVGLRHGRSAEADEVRRLPRPPGGARERKAGGSGSSAEEFRTSNAGDIQGGSFGGGSLSPCPRRQRHQDCNGQRGGLQEGE